MKELLDFGLPISDLLLLSSITFGDCIQYPLLQFGLLNFMGPTHLAYNLTIC